MTGQRWSSPFGARPISAAAVAAEVRLRARQNEIAQRRETGCAPPEGRVADKWQLLRLLSEAAGPLALSDRTVCVLEALLSFQPGKELDGGAPVIVFPSNRELSLRSRGMAPATLRRHLALLVDAGMIVRRDSANGKRFRRAGHDGEAAEAFGFDLSPFALKAGEIAAAAETGRRERRDAARLRSALSIHRRDLRKLLDAAEAEGREGDWAGFASRLAALALPRGCTLLELRAAEGAVVRLRAEVETLYLALPDVGKTSACDAESERHYQSLNTYPLSESKDSGLEGKEREPETSATPMGRRSPPVAKPRSTARPGLQPCLRSPTPSTAPLPEEAARASGVDLATVLRLCPDIGHYGRQPLRSWSDLRAVADLVRGFLGVSADAYAKARAAMGEVQAAVVVAAMLQRAAHIRSPGGYLRNLTAMAEQGRFEVGPMLRALEGAP